MVDLPPGGLPRRGPAPRLSPLKDTLVITTWDDPPPPAPESAQTLPRRPNSVGKLPPNGDLPNTNSIPRRPHSIAVTSVANGINHFKQNGPSVQTPLYRPPAPPTTCSSQPIRRPVSIAATPTTPSNQHNGFPYKAMNGFPPWTSQLPPIINRRPHSVATTPMDGNGNIAEVPPRNVPWNGIHHPIPRRPHSIAVTEAAGDVKWSPVRLPPLQHPVARRPPPMVLQYPNFTTPNTTWGNGSPRRPTSITSVPANNLNLTTTAIASPSDSGYRSLPSSQSDYQVHNATLVNGLPPHDPRRLAVSVHSQMRPSPTFHGTPFKPFTCGSATTGAPLFLGCTHAHGSKTGTPATTPSKTASSTPSSIREAVQHLLMQPRNGFNIMDDRMSIFIDILDAQERFSQVNNLSSSNYRDLAKLALSF